MDKMDKLFHKHDKDHDGKDKPEKEKEKKKEDNDDDDPKRWHVEGMLAKATRMLGFLSGKSGNDMSLALNDIPSDLLHDAHGLGFFSLAKAGCLVGVEGGFGIVVADLGHGKWSPPAAYQLGSASFGLQIGASVVDLLFVFTSKADMQTLLQTGMIKLGSDLEVTLGPVGRNIKNAAGVGGGKGALCYSYNVSKGAFAGMSLDGGALWPHSHENKRFYDKEVTPEEILGGKVPAPKCAELDMFYVALKHELARR